GARHRLKLSHISPRPTAALQATLFQLTQLAAQALAGRAADPDGLTVGLTVLYDPAMHGTVREPDLRGLDVRRRAVLVIERGRSGLVLDPGRTAAELVEEAAAQARVGERAGAPIFSREADTTEARLAVSTAPQPVAGAAVRPTAVAGQFYPGDPAALGRMVEEMLGDERGGERWPAAMVPHAGLRFSGRL